MEPEKTQDPSDMFLQSKLFNQALSKQTSHYIQSKLLSLPKDAQDLKKLDLRHMCETVVEELEVVQKQAAYDYIKVSQQLQQLGNQLTVTDGIMEQLENVLYSFKNHLESIKSEMTTLQQKSNKMNTSLKNRKDLQRMLSSFIDSAVLDRQLIDAICLSEIDESYTQHIKTLQKKLGYLNNNLISPDSKAVKQLQPQLEKLKARASVRMKDFLLEQFNALKKPKTNIQIVQKNVLVKYKIFMEFFKDYAPPVYTDLCNAYREIMAKVYLSNYKVYLSEIYKLQVQLYTKTDLLIPYDPQHLRSFLTQTKPTNLNQDKKSIFTLMGRERIIQQNQVNDVILYNVANQKGQKFPVQQVFKSVNKVLMDGIISQILFTAEFFNVKPQAALDLFGPVFRPSLNVFLQYLKSTVASTYDIFGVLVILAINDRNKQIFHDKNFSGLDFYFDQVNMTLWPKFEQLFDINLKGVSSNNPKSFRILEKTATVKVLIDRFADFMISMYRLCCFFPNSKMINPRMETLRKGFFDLIKKIGDQFQKDVDGIAYYLNILQIYHANTVNDTGTKSTQFYDDQAKLQKQIAGLADRIVTRYIAQFFPSLDQLVKKHLKEDGQFCIQGTVSMQQLNTIINDLSSSSFSGKIQKLMAHCQKSFSGYTLKVLLKNFNNIFISYYSEFYKYVKNSAPDSAALMYQPHNMMKEIKSLVKYL